jgi:hypothetical protein
VEATPFVQFPLGNWRNSLENKENPWAKQVQGHDTTVTKPDLGGGIIDTGTQQGSLP